MAVGVAGELVIDLAQRLDEAGDKGDRNEEETRGPSTDSFFLAYLLTAGILLTLHYYQLEKKTERAGLTT